MSLWQEDTPFPRIILYVVFVISVAFFLWAAWAQIDITVSANGRVVPSSRLQVIQSLDGGVLEAVEVREGQSVRKGDVLLRVDDTRFAADLLENSSRLYALKAAEARLVAENTGRPLHMPEVLVKEYPGLVSAEVRLKASREAELVQKRETLRRSLEIARDELDLTQPLLAKGAASEVEVLRLRRQVSELEGAIAEAEKRFRAIAGNELARVQMELAALEAQSVTGRDRVSRTVLRAPMDGVVKAVRVNTAGQVIEPGASLMEIVPVDDALLVEASIAASDVGFLHKGQKAAVQVTAFDYGIYGSLPGSVDEVSADSFVDEQTGNSFYRVRILTDRAWLQDGSRRLNVLPGMQVTARITTGQRSILDYLIQPMTKTVGAAMHER